MSEFNRYGIKIEKLKLKDIEILRKWRNNPKISSLMLSQNGEYITKEQQLKWYDSIKDKTDALYYMVFVDEIAVGYFCFQQIANKCAVPGEILVIPSQMDQARITFGAYCAVYDMAFEILGLEQLKAYSKLENKRAIRMARLLNFQTTHTDNQCIYFELDKDDYYQMRDSLIAKLGLS
ncbi:MULTISPECIES: GNAT family N-acetyltransferase [Campylobacter]|uniref:GNAT family N-acetyltransferase n=1 Tax=Campylobacter TaxID=194 RepID=UPI000A339CE1|nr:MULTISPECIES: GNAT family N-acetyltransferase [unclassified Campylobacter]